MADTERPPQSAHDPFILAWLAEHPSPQMRRDVVTGAVAIGPWSQAQRDMPPSSKTPGKFASLLHQQAWYRIWPLRDKFGLVAALGDGTYVLTEAGQRQAASPEQARTTASLQTIGQPFEEDLVLPDRLQSPTVVFEYDPDLRDKQTRAHQVLVMRLIIAIRKLGYAPVKPAGQAPLYDLAFVGEDGESLVVIEVKSLSEEHAVHQLRLGLGQSSTTPTCSPPIVPCPLRLRCRRSRRRNGRASAKPPASR